MIVNWSDVTQIFIAEQIMESEVSGSKTGDEVHVNFPDAPKVSLHIHGKPCKVKAILLEVE